MPAFPLAKQKDKSSLDSNCIKKLEQNTLFKMSQLRALKNPAAGLSTVGYSMQDSNSPVFSLPLDLIRREPTNMQGAAQCYFLRKEPLSMPDSEQKYRDSNLGLSGARVRGSPYTKSIRLIQKFY